MSAPASSPGALRWSLPVYLKIVTLSTQIAYAYRFRIVVQLIGLLLQIFLLKVVWTAVYDGRESVDGVDLGTLLTYLTIANLQIWLLFPSGGDTIQQRVREGRVAQDLARPIGLVGQLFSYQLGMTLGFLPMVVIAAPAALVAGVLRPPASPEAAVLYVASVALAFAVVALMGLLLGMIAFWTLEITGVLVMHRFANLFFAGGLVPLWFFPEPLRVVAQLLPFQTQGHLPVSIYVGRLQGADAIAGLVISATWVVVLWAAVRFVWSRALKRVVVQGG